MYYVLDSVLCWGHNNEQHRRDPCLIGFTGLKFKSVSTISVIIGKLSVCYVQYNIAGQSL